MFDSYNKFEGHNLKRPPISNEPIQFYRSIEVFKMKVFILTCILFTIYFLRGVQSDCCKKQINIVFDPKGYNECSDIENGSNTNVTFLPKCVVSVCGDGRDHEGTFCDIGSCNIFGCNCDGGCHQGDNKSALERFKKNNAEGITLARFMTSDEFQRWIHA